MDRVRPIGISLVGMFTVLTALGVLFFAFFIFAFGTALEGIDTLVLTYTGLIGALGILLLADTVLIFRGIRVGYFLSMASWILLVFFDIWLGYWFGYFFPITAILVLYPLLSFGYFSTGRVKTYFSI